MVAMAAAGAAVGAAFTVDSDLMRSIDDTAKNLDSSVSMHDAAAAAQARELADLFAQVEAYYAQKGDAADAVGFAHHTRELAVQAAEAAQAQNFDAATEAVDSLTRSCKTCHQVYKKD